jgi:hypothetical protein
MIEHKKLDNHLETKYNFKSLWQEKCNKFNIDEQPFILPPVRRIIVIGDIHGDMEMTLESLRIANLIDQNNNWCGKDTVVVQVGDQIDRCRLIDTNVPCYLKEATDPDEHNDLNILEYFTKLHHQAQKKGGAVYSLLGNHEIMNVEQNLSYVSYEGIQGFNNYVKPDGSIIKNGRDARLWAFKNGNPISEFLACTRQVALIIGSNLFVHAGILPQIAEKYSVSSINKLMSLYLFDKIKRNNKYYDELFNFAEYSPIWNRVFGNFGNNNLDDQTTCNYLLQPLEQIYNVGNIYVGHTPMMNTGISSICDNKIWLTDYGSSKAFDKFDKNFRSKSRQPHVLEILDDGREINVLKKNNNL